MAVLLKLQGYTLHLKLPLPDHLGCATCDSSGRWRAKDRHLQAKKHFTECHPPSGGVVKLSFKCDDCHRDFDNYTAGSRHMKNGCTGQPYVPPAQPTRRRNNNYEIRENDDDLEIFTLLVFHWL